MIYVFCLLTERQSQFSDSTFLAASLVGYIGGQCNLFMSHELWMVD